MTKSPWAEKWERFDIAKRMVIVEKGNAQLINY
jgi:hypothetical protein